MRRFEPHSGRRGGFTLVELLVVITIIAILAALTSAAVVKALGTGDELKLRNEITQLANAVQAFKTHFNVSYIPDLIVLPPSGDPATAQYFASVWPRLPRQLISPQNAAEQNAARLYWNPGGANNQVFLQGDQCLVYFLGGPADASGNRIGWSSDPTNPMKLTGSRAPIFYEFPTDRLKVYTSSPLTRSPTHPSLVDVYGISPYVYFSTNRADNSYSANSRIQILSPIAVDIYPFLKSGTLAANPRFVNPSGFQIISAGKDGVFGGGANGWAGFAGGGATTIAGYDDVANFAKSKLGIPDN